MNKYYFKRKPKDAQNEEKGHKTRTKQTPQKKKSNLVDKLDRAFSAYIRLRDTMPSGYFKCISCGQIKPFEQADCGHFFSRKNMSVRFDEDDCHAECRGCNRFSSDHLIAYQANLIRKIGMQRFELLTAKSHQVKKWSDFELETMIEYYKREAKRLSSLKGIRVDI